MLHFLDKASGVTWSPAQMVAAGRGCWGDRLTVLEPMLCIFTSAPVILTLEPAPSLNPLRGPGHLLSSLMLSRPLPTDYSTMQAVQATMILSTILCCIAFLIFLLQLFRLKQGERFVLTSIIQLMSCKYNGGLPGGSTSFPSHRVGGVRSRGAGVDLERGCWPPCCGGTSCTSESGRVRSEGRGQRAQDTKPEPASVG